VRDNGGARIVRHGDGPAVTADRGAAAQGGNAAGVAAVAARAAHALGEDAVARHAVGDDAAVVHDRDAAAVATVLRAAARPHDAPAVASRTGCAAGADRVDAVRAVADGRDRAVVRDRDLPALGRGAAGTAVPDETVSAPARAGPAAAALGEDAVRAFSERGDADARRHLDGAARAGIAAARPIDVDPVLVAALTAVAADARGVNGVPVVRDDLDVAVRGIHVHGQRVGCFTVLARLRGDADERAPVVTEGIRNTDVRADAVVAVVAVVPGHGLPRVGVRVTGRCRYRRVAARRPGRTLRRRLRGQPRRELVVDRLGDLQRLLRVGIDRDRFDETGIVVDGHGRDRERLRGTRRGERIADREVDEEDVARIREDAVTRQDLDDRGVLAGDRVRDGIADLRVRRRLLG